METPAPRRHSQTLWPLQVPVSCHMRLQKQATGVPRLLPSIPSIGPLLELATHSKHKLFPTAWNRQVWLLLGALRVERWNLRPQGREGAQQRPGNQLSQAKPLHPEQREPGDRVGRGSRVHPCTLYSVSQPHNAQVASGAGSQGPLMPVPSGSPCQASEGQLKKLDSVLGHSQALFLSQGGMRDSPCSEWRPLVR